MGGAGGERAGWGGWGDGLTEDRRLELWIYMVEDRMVGDGMRDDG